MNMDNFCQIVCPECKAKLFAEKSLDKWYCGYCGEKIELEHKNADSTPATPVPTGDVFVCNGNILVKYTGHDENIEIPENITKIEVGAFKDNTDIRSVTIPESVEEIDASAFENCTSLVSVVLPKNENLKKISYKLFSGCKNLKTITVPESVEEILHGAMCCGIEEIVLESSSTTWELGSDYADPSFEVCRKSSGEGVKKIYIKGNSYDATDVYKFKSMSSYFKSQGLCPECGGKFNSFSGLFGLKCKSCGKKKEQ